MRKIFYASVLTLFCFSTMQNFCGDCGGQEHVESKCPFGGGKPRR